MPHGSWQSSTRDDCQLFLRKARVSDRAVVARAEDSDRDWAAGSEDSGAAGVAARNPAAERFPADSACPPPFPAKSRAVQAGYLVQAEAVVEVHCQGPVRACPAEAPAAPQTVSAIHWCWPRGSRWPQTLTEEHQRLPLPERQLHCEVLISQVTPFFKTGSALYAKLLAPLYAGYPPYSEGIDIA